MNNIGSNEIKYFKKYLKYKKKYLDLKGGSRKKRPILSVTPSNQESKATSQVPESFNASHNVANDLEKIINEINLDNIMEVHKIDNIKENGLIDKSVRYKINQNIEKSDFRYVLHLLAFDAIINFENLQINKNNLIKHILEKLTGKSEFYQDFFVIDFMRRRNDKNEIKESFNIPFDHFLTHSEFGPVEEYITSEFRNVWNEIERIYLEMRQARLKKMGAFIRVPEYNQFLGKTIIKEEKI